MGRVCYNWNSLSWDVCAIRSSQPTEKDETSRKCWQFKHDYIFSTHDLARNIMWFLTAWIIWLQGKYHALTILQKICGLIEQASPLCIIYNSFSISCDGISLTATASLLSYLLRIVLSHLLWPLNKRSEDALFTGLASTLKVRKNGQQKTCNLFCNIAAEQVE